MLVDSFTRVYYQCEFDSLINCCSFLSSKIQKEGTDFRNNYKNELESVEERDRDDYEMFLDEQNYNLKFVYPNLLWNSYFLLSYSIFEKFINDICLCASRKSSADIELKDLNGQGIVRARIFLLKVIKLDSFITDKDWEEIRFLGDLRNIIAHTGGTLKYNNDNHKKISKKIIGRIGITISNKSENGLEFYLSEDFLISAIKTFQRSINELARKKIGVDS